MNITIGKMPNVILGVCVDRALLAKSLAVITVGGACLYLYKWRKSLGASAAIGPYTPCDKVCARRMLQNMLREHTRQGTGEPLFPVDSISDWNPSRSSDNGHAVSGAVRDAARETIRNAVSDHGCMIHEISPARQSNPTTYTHQHFAPADLDRAISSEIPPVNSVVVGIDVDFHISDLSSVLGYCNPAIFFTFSPNNVAGVDGDCHYRIVNNKVVYEVGGGSRWEHHVWDWTGFGEYFKINARHGWLSWKNLLGLIGLHKKIIYKVHVARPWASCKDRVLVWVIPNYTYWEIDWCPSDLRVREMQRISYQDKRRPGWNIIVREQDGVLKVNVGRENEDATVTLMKSDYDVLMGLTSAQSVTTRMINMGYESPNDKALFSQYHAGKEHPIHETYRMGRSIAAAVHWPITLYNDKPETSAREYATPVIDDANMVPQAKRWETLSNSIDYRVTNVHNNKTPSAKIQSFAVEFVRLVVPESNIGDPYSLEETASMLDKPSQTLAIQQVWETADAEGRKLIECFIKNEATDKPGRIISSFPDMRYLLQFSTFTLKFRDEVLHAEHNKHWFCPGLTPQQIATKVCEFVQKIGEPLEGDFSNFDGTVSAWMQRSVMNAVYLRYFHRSHYQKLRSMTDMLISCPARAKRFGFKYEAGVGVKSGSPTTCDLNTVANAFIQYAATRLRYPELPQEDAFRLIGLAFGDDSLTDASVGRNLSRVAKELGMQLKLEKYEQDKGLVFLARVYPDPYTTETTFQDPLRTWKKLHLTTRDPNVPLADAAYDRMEGYMVTDKLSPLTGKYASMIQRLYRTEIKDHAKRMKRKERDSEKPYWSTVGGAWPQAEVDVELMLQVAAARTGIPPETIRGIEERLTNSTTVWFSDNLVTRGEETTKKSTVLADGTETPDVDARKYKEMKSTVEDRARDKQKPTSSGVGNKNPPRKDNRPRANKPKPPGPGDKTPIGPKRGR